jgi:predicted alpha/beta hydrolase family esterase
MQKRVFIIHGWGGKPKAGWLAWLKKELSSKGFRVYAPEMPDKENPKIKPWVNHLKKIVGKPDKDAFFVGHSIGCQAIMRYLEKLPSKAKVGGVVFVAGWFNLKGLEPEEIPFAKPWLTKPINFKKVRQKSKKIIALFSEDDPYVYLKDSKIFKRKIGAKIIIQKNKGHFIEDVTKKIPAVLKELLKIAK